MNKVEKAVREDAGSIINDAIINGTITTRDRIGCASGWRIEKDGMFISSDNFVPADLKYNHKGKIVSVKEACELLDELCGKLRCSDWSELGVQAEVARALADALIKLQK